MHESPTSSVEERTDEAHRYLTALWPAGFRTDAVLSLVTLPGGASYRFTLDQTHDAAAQAVALADQGLDVYAGMGLIDPDAGGRGKAGDVWHIPGAWADIDILGPTHKATDLPPTREAALAALAELPPPTMLVDSGGGFQAHWVGEGVWAPAAGDVVEGIQAALRSVFSARGWSLDGTADVSRIFRVPGTINYKEPGNPRPVRLVQLDGPRYNPGPLRDRFVVAEAVRETCAVPDEPPYSGDGYGLEDALTNLAEACDAIETAGPGESNDVLKAKAYYIGGMIPHDLDYSHALEQLTEAAERRITDDPNVGARIANQLEAGMEEPWYLCEIAEDEAPGALPDEFWTARPELAHIRQAAHARQRSAPAVLHAALARVAAGAPHNLRLPPIVGSAGTLSYFAAIVAPSGVGKSNANGIATELLPLAQNVADQLPLGSGEGLAQVLFELVEEAGADGKKSRLKKQVRHNAYLYVDEGQLVGSVGQRQGSTLLPTLRTIWSGGTIGQTNASTERRRIVPAGSYTYGVTVGLQDAHAGSLLNDADGGTPQRFGWAHATDPTIPDEAPAWPGALRISHVAASQVTVAEIATGALPAPRYMEVAPSIEAEIRAGDLAKARGQVQVNALDGHAGLYRLKVAALLALLAGRNDVTVEDWHLAATVHAASNAVRSGLIATVRERSRAADQATNARYAERAVASAEAVERRRTVDCARKLVRLVQDGEAGTVSEARRRLRGYSEVFEDALAHAVAEGWVTEQEVPGQGAPKRSLKAAA